MIPEDSKESLNSTPFTGYLRASPERAAAEPGDLVPDPFAGTGTTGVAAKQLGRHYVLIESNKEYAEFARDRLRTPTAELQAPPEQPQAVVEEEIVLDEPKEPARPARPSKKR